MIEHVIFSFAPSPADHACTLMQGALRIYFHNGKCFTATQSTQKEKGIYADHSLQFIIPYKTGTKVIMVEYLHINCELSWELCIRSWCQPCRALACNNVDCEKLTWLVSACFNTKGLYFAVATMAQKTQWSQYILLHFTWFELEGSIGSSHEGHLKDL